MARYLETAKDLGKEVEALMADLGLVNEKATAVAVRVGHIINLAIRACPRGVQHTVRKNIVAEAVGKYCHVTMTEETDELRGTTYHKIHIQGR